MVLKKAIDLLVNHCFTYNEIAERVGITRREIAGIRKGDKCKEFTAYRLKGWAKARNDIKTWKQQDELLIQYSTSKLKLELSYRK